MTDSYVERLPAPELTGVVRTVWIQQTGASAYVQRLEHLGSRSTECVDRSWEIAHADGSGGVYANFPDPDLVDWARAYHGGNARRLARIKRAYDPDRLFDFPQCIEPDTQEDS